MRAPVYTYNSLQPRSFSIKTGQAAFPNFSILGAQKLRSVDGGRNNVDEALAVNQPQKMLQERFEKFPWTCVNSYSSWNLVTVLRDLL